VHLYRFRNDPSSERAFLSPNKFDIARKRRNKGVVPVFIVGFLLRRGISNVGGDH